MIDKTNNNMVEHGQATDLNHAHLTPGARLGQEARKIVLGLMAALGSYMPTASTVGTAVGAGAVATSLQSCKLLGEGVNPADKLTPEQQAFVASFDPTNQKLLDKGWVKPSILDGKPVVTVPVAPSPNNTNFTEAFKGFMDIELRLVDAKARTYTITPIINRSSLEKILTKAQQEEPGKDLYFVGLINQALSSTGIKRDLTGGIFFNDRDDNNPSTRSPYLDQLPERFALDEYNKYNQFANLSKTFNLSAGEFYNMIVGPSIANKELDVINFSINPSLEAQSIVNKTGN
jgi:hypothetical protein